METLVRQKDEEAAGLMRRQAQTQRGVDSEFDARRSALVRLAHCNSGVVAFDVGASAHEAARRSDAAAVAVANLHAFVEVTAIGKELVPLAKKFLASGLSPAQAATLFAQVGACLSHKPEGFSRAEWLQVCAELYDQQETAEGRA